MKCTNKGLLSCGKDATHGKFCAKHAVKCEICGKAATVKFCAKHECLTIQCHEKVKDNSKCCDMHSCVLCSEESLPDKRYCSEHMCNFFRCEEESQTGSDYCQLHTCKYNTVSTSPSHIAPDQIIACKNPVHNSGNFCETHSCKYCNTMVDDDTDCCDKHLCQACGVPAQNGYCKQHQCMYEKGCTVSQTSESIYCDGHKCKKCTEQIVESGMYCVSHTCTVTDCMQFSLEGYKYCTAHKCGSCQAIAVNGSFCKKHVCDADGCDGGKIKNSKWCVSHVCHICDKFTKRKFFGMPACDKHFGLCIDCIDKPAFKPTSRCTPCNNTHEIMESLADARQYMVETTTKLDTMKHELKTIQDVSAKEIEKLRTETLEGLREAKNIGNNAYQAAIDVQSNVNNVLETANNARAIAEEVHQNLNNQNSGLNNMEQRINNAQREIDNLKRNTKPMF